MTVFVIVTVLMAVVVVLVSVFVREIGGHDVNLALLSRSRSSNGHTLVGLEMPA
jgi:hypothetical protein